MEEKILSEGIESVKKSLDEALEEAAKKKAKTKAHYPFKNQTKRGPGPDGEFGTKVDKKVNKWSCKKRAKYSQICVGVGKDNKGQKKVVDVDKDWKGAYNPVYAKWRAGKEGGKKKTTKKVTKKASAKNPNYVRP